MTNVVSFRPRSEVMLRSVPRTRSPEPRHAFEGPQPITVEAGVKFFDLWKALDRGGFSIAYDERTSCMLVRKRE